MTFASIEIDRPAAGKRDRLGDHLRIVSDRSPRQDAHRDPMRGDDNARFANVVMPHLGDAYALARWITANATDAEDVVQEACLRAFRAIGGFAGGSARAWVLTIVRNTAYTWLGKNRPAALVAVDDLEAVEHAQAIPGDPNAETPETALIAQADAARLKSAIGDLPVAFRETLILRDVQGLDYREIAAVTGVPIGTVMSRLARARRRLIATIGRKDS
jgi:RNA polymerase sigma factor (sigma-70 family)